MIVSRPLQTRSRMAFRYLISPGMQLPQVVLGQTGAILDFGFPPFDSVFWTNSCEESPALWTPILSSEPTDSLDHCSDPWLYKESIDTVVRVVLAPFIGTPLHHLCKKSVYWHQSSVMTRIYSQLCKKIVQLSIPIPPSLAEGAQTLAATLGRDDFWE